MVKFLAKPLPQLCDLNLVEDDAMMQLQCVPSSLRPQLQAATKQAANWHQSHRSSISMLPSKFLLVVVEKIMLINRKAAAAGQLPGKAYTTVANELGFARRCDAKQ